MEIEFTKQEMIAFEKEVKNTLDSIERTMTELEKGLKINKLLMQSIQEWKKKKS